MNVTRPGALGVYVAGSSAEIARASAWMRRLADAGVRVTSTWPQLIEQSGGIANPRHAPADQRFAWSAEDLAQVAAADVLWMLAPQPAPREPPGRGAYFELGYAYALGRVLVASGETSQSIFCSVAHEFGDDGSAFDFIVRQV